MITLDVSGSGPSFAKQFEQADIDHCDPANSYQIAVAALNVAEQLLRAVIQLREDRKS